MFSLTGSLTFMATISCLAGYDGTLSVSQHPREITSSVGMTAMIACEVHYHDKIPLQTDVYWYKGDPLPQNALTTLRDFNSSRDSHLYVSGSLSKHFFILVITNLTLSDSGVYTCEVSVPLPPPLVNQYGNGTRLIVQESNSCVALETSTEMKKGIIILVLSIYSVVVTISAVALAILLHFHAKPKGMLITNEVSRGPEESQLNSFRGHTSSPGTDQTREAHSQEYEDMAFFRTMNQQKS